MFYSHVSGCKVGRRTRKGGDVNLLLGTLDSFLPWVVRLRRRR